MPKKKVMKSAGKEAQLPAKKKDKGDRLKMALKAGNDDVISSSEWATGKKRYVFMTGINSHGSFLRIEETIRGRTNVVYVDMINVDLFVEQLLEAKRRFEEQQTAKVAGPDIPVPGPENETSTQPAESL